jgi:hypothetical protein
MILFILVAQLQNHNFCLKKTSEITLRGFFMPFRFLQLLKNPSKARRFSDSAMNF